MYRNFKIVKIDSKYCDYLRKYDNKVAYNFGEKDLRPFVGVLFYVGTVYVFCSIVETQTKTY